DADAGRNADVRRPVGSTMLMPMRGEAWPAAAAAFVGMWVMMMAAMMLPSLLPMLARYRRGVAQSLAPNSTMEARLAWLTTLVGAAYFLVWAVLGAGVYTLATTLAAIAWLWPAAASAAPIAAGAVVAIAGAIQLTPWKTRHLASCHEGADRGCATLP